MRAGSEGPGTAVLRIPHLVVVHDAPYSCTYSPQSTLREIEELGVDDTIGSWLQSTLSKRHTLSTPLVGRDLLRRSKTLGPSSLLGLSSKPKTPGSSCGERRKRVSSESLSTGSPLAPAGGQHAAAAIAAATTGGPESGQQGGGDQISGDAVHRGQPRRCRDGEAEGTAEKGVEGVLGRSPHERSVVDGLGRKHMHSPAAATMALVQSALDTWSNDCICLEARLG